MKVNEYITAHNRLMEDWIVNIPDNSVNVVCTDPPYKYLKNQKLESDWDEVLFFDNVKRILKDDGFIILFGRGSSFYRWNSMLDERNFIFKEEVIWDKGYTSSPAHSLSRVHETVSIWSKKSGVINKSMVNYLKMRLPELHKLEDDLKRIMTAFKNKKAFSYIEHYLKTGERLDMEVERKVGSKATFGSKAKGHQAVSPVVSIVEGMREKSIIKSTRKHYGRIHPTEKPVELIERLLKLVVSENSNVFDFFSGSFSTAIACNNLKLNFEGCEKEEEYFILGVENIKYICSQGTFFSV